METKALFEIRDLEVTDKKTHLLDQITLNIEPTKVHLLLGENGSGKSTLIKTLLGLYPNSAGEIKKDDDATVAFIPEAAYFFHYTVEGYIKMMQIFSGTPKEKIDSVVEKVLINANLVEHRKKKAHKLSSGMKQRLLYHNAIIDRPKLVIADEPTSNLDQKARKDFFDMVSQTEGVSFLISTHHLNEVIEFADTITLLKKGKIEYTGNAKDFIKQYASIEYTLTFDDTSVISDEFLNDIKEIKYKQIGNALIVATETDFKFVRKTSMKHGLPLLSISRSVDSNELRSKDEN